jgi:hypothetical protein
VDPQKYQTTKPNATAIAMYAADHQAASFSVGSCGDRTCPTMSTVIIVTMTAARPIHPIACTSMQVPPVRLCVGTGGLFRPGDRTAVPSEERSSP